MTKQKIYDIAFELFSKGHYNSVSILEISQKAGIKKPSIYAHFDSKESLFLNIFEEESSKIYKRLTEVIYENEKSDTKVILSKILIESIKYITENKPVGGFLAYLFFVTPYDLPKKIVCAIDEFKNLIKNLIIKVIKNGIRKEEINKEDAEGITYSYYCLLQGNILMELKSDIFKMDNVYESLNYFLKGIESKI